MDDLAAFLAACYDEAEVIAKRATDGPWIANGSEIRGCDRDYSGGTEGAILVVKHTWPQEAAHIVACDPAHRLADIALKRAILAGHRPETPKYGHDIPRCTACITDRGRYPDDWQGDPWPCKTVRHLGTEFAAKPGYREEWKP